MYSGITRGLFPVVQVSRAPGLLSYSVDLGAELSAGLALGASVAIDGVCQTVASLDGTRVGFDAIQETLNLTTSTRSRWADWSAWSAACAWATSWAVTRWRGTWWGRGEIAEVRLEGHDVAMRVRVPEAFMPYILPKGFIAVDGSSLTVGRTYPDGFTLHLIPETLRLTNFGSRHVGDLVNIELDPRTVAIVHTVERVLAQRLATQASP
jgi:riboflavin synthase